MYIIAYDISSSDRLREIARICEKYATRIQKSVFESNMSRSDMKLLKKELKSVINKDEDSVIMYTIPISSIKAKITMGKEPKNPYILM